MEKLAILLQKLKAGEINIRKLAAVTGIPPTRMYKWKDRDSDISYEDAKILAEWAEKNVDNSPPTHGEDKDRTIADLAYSTRKLVDNNTAMVEMHREFLEKFYASLNAPSGASLPLKPKEPLVPDPTEELPDKQDTDSEKRQGRQKDSVKS